MNEEIKTKITEEAICLKGIDEMPMFSWNTKTREFYVLGHKFDGINSIEDFINYIHNLEKENTQLKSVIKEIREYIERQEVNSIGSFFADTPIGKDLLQILDKGDK